MTGEPIFDLTGKRIFVAGHLGMVGSAIVRRLTAEPVMLLLAPRSELDLTRQSDVEAWMAGSRPDVVVVAAAKVGGILANATYPVDFLEQNLLIELNLIRSSLRCGVQKLLFLGSSCIYPREWRRPIAEEDLLAGPLEPTNQWYAIAKIAGVKLCQAYRRQYGADFVSVMPTNLYGPGDNFDPIGSHVVPALIRKMHDAKQHGDSAVEVWGTGRPKRELLYVDDLANACIHILRQYSDEMHLNVGSGTDISISDLAELIRDIVGFAGRIRFDHSKPDGAPRKLLDVSRLAGLGWKPSVDLGTGLAKAYSWYLENGAVAS